jgi:hypothetical protein
MRVTNFAVGIALATAFPGWAQNAPVGDPLTVDPLHYHLEIDNQWVRVYREHMEPHGKLGLHRHPAPGAVVVYLTDQNTRQTMQDGTMRMLNHKVGDVAWRPASVHQSENLGDQPFEAVQIEPKRLPAQPFPKEIIDAVIVDPTRFRVEVENEWVRVIRANVEGHAKLVTHKHPATAAVVVNISAQDQMQVHADGARKESHYKAGQIRWGLPEAAHADENLSDKRFELIRVEIKAAR